MQHKMRKESREMPARWALTEVFDKAPFVTLSMTSPDGEPYGVPVSLVRADETTFYFHCAPEGKKIELWEANPVVWLSAVSRCKPTVGPKDGSFTLEFRSAMARGIVERVEEREEQIRALRLIAQRFLPHHMDAFDDAVGRSLARTALYRISLTEPPVGKRKQYDAQGEEMKFGRME